MVSGVAFSQDAEPAESEPEARPITAAEVQEKLRQWVRTRQLIGEEQADWAAEQQSLEDLMALREREVGQLDELIAAAGSRLTDAEAERSSLLEEEAALQARRTELEAKVAELEAAARQVVGAFPRPLREKLGDAIERLEAGEEIDTPLQNRYRDVLAILIEAGSFQTRLTLDSELREIDGVRREVEVLYLGLARAYYVDRSGRHAGTGRPAEDGWQWTEAPELATEIRRTLDIYQKKGDPQLVELPVSGAKGEGKGAQP